MELLEDKMYEEAGFEKLKSDHNCKAATMSLRATTYEGVAQFEKIKRPLWDGEKVPVQWMMDKGCLGQVVVAFALGGWLQPPPLNACYNHLRGGEGEIR
jgi:hypothetical protein